jgi:hypothetical protein
MRFELIKGASTLEETTYFEFVKDSNKKKVCWNENAHYLEMGVFIYWVNVFQKASDRFDYFSFCKFNQEELKRLKQSLSEFENSLNKVSDVNEFKAFFENSYERMFFGENIEETWRERIIDLIKINRELSAIVADCLNNKEVLWVLGI